MTNLPNDVSSADSARIGLKIFIPPFIAPAHFKTSGTKRMPSLKSIPTIFIPPTRASPRTSLASQPLASSISVPSVTSASSPS